MKKILSILGLSFVLFFTGSAFADRSVAVIDVMFILEQMPQRESILKTLKTEFDSRAKGLQAEEKKANTAAQKLKKDGMTLSASEKTKLTNVIAGFQEKANQLSADYRQRENQEVNKLLVLIQEQVKKVAQAEKYDIVLKGEAVFYAENVVDITDKVLEQVKK